MNIHDNKKQKNKSIANTTSRENSVGRSALQLVDNRSKTPTQLKLQNRKSVDIDEGKTFQLQRDNLPIQRVVTTGDLTTSDDHIKGNPQKKTKKRKGKPVKTRTQSSEEVIRRAQKAVVDGTANNVSIESNEEVFEVPRKNPKSKKAPRRFNKHRGGGDGKTFGFFEVQNSERGANSNFEFSDSESESELEDKKEDINIKEETTDLLGSIDNELDDGKEENVGDIPEEEARLLLGNLYDELYQLDDDKKENVDISEEEGRRLLGSLYDEL